MKSMISKALCKLGMHSWEYKFAVISWKATEWQECKGVVRSVMNNPAGRIKLTQI